jgi:hypothetical protein
MDYPFRFKKLKVPELGKAAIASCELMLNKNYSIAVVLAVTDHTIFPHHYVPWVKRFGLKVHRSPPIQLSGTSKPRAHPWHQFQVKLEGAEAKKEQTQSFRVEAYFCDEALQNLHAQQGGWIAAIGRLDLAAAFTVSETAGFLYLEARDA